MLSLILLQDKPRPPTLANLNHVAWSNRIVAGCHRRVDLHATLLDEPTRLAVGLGEAAVDHSFDESYGKARLEFLDLGGLFMRPKLQVKVGLRIVGSFWAIQPVYELPRKQRFRVSGM